MVYQCAICVERSALNFTGDVTDVHVKKLRKLEMAAVGSGRGAMESQNQVESDTVDRLKSLYPNVNEEDSPLPRAWSTKDKFSYIGLSQNNLRVHYKGKSFKVCLWISYLRNSSSMLFRVI